jgi:hypothetical protein
MKGIGDVTKEEEVSVVEWWSFDLRIGWEFCNLWSEV